MKTYTIVLAFILATLVKGDSIYPVLDRDLISANCVIGINDNNTLHCFVVTGNLGYSWGESHFSSVSPRVMGNTCVFIQRLFNATYVPISDCPTSVYEFRLRGGNIFIGNDMDNPYITNLTTEVLKTNDRNDRIGNYVLSYQYQSDEHALGSILKIEEWIYLLVIGIFLGIL